MHPQHRAYAPKSFGMILKIAKRLKTGTFFVQLQSYWSLKLDVQTFLFLFTYVMPKKIHLRLNLLWQNAEKLRLFCMTKNTYKEITREEGELNKHTSKYKKIQVKEYVVHLQYQMKFLHREFQLKYDPIDRRKKYSRRISSEEWIQWTQDQDRVESTLAGHYLDIIQGQCERNEEKLCSIYRIIFEIYWYLWYARYTHAHVFCLAATCHVSLGWSWIVTNANSTISSDAAASDAATARFVVIVSIVGFFVHFNHSNSNTIIGAYMFTSSFNSAGVEYGKPDHSTVYILSL